MPDNADTYATTGRLHGSDIWHEVQVNERLVKLLCSGRITSRDRVIVDLNGTNMTCRLCERKAEKAVVLRRWGNPQHNDGEQDAG